MKMMNLMLRKGLWTLTEKIAIPKICQRKHPMDFNLTVLHQKLHVRRQFSKNQRYPGTYEGPHGICGMERLKLLTKLRIKLLESLKKIRSIEGQCQYYRVLLNANKKTWHNLKFSVCQSAFVLQSYIIWGTTFFETTLEVVIDGTAK